MEKDTTLQNKISEKKITPQAIYVKRLTADTIVNSVIKENHYMPAREYSHFKADWMIVVMIVSLVIFGWVWAFFRKHIVHILQASYDYKISYKLMAERSTLTARVSLILNLLFIINFGLFFYEASAFYGITIFKMQGFIFFLFLTGALGLIYLFKYLFYSFIGYVINLSGQIYEYLHNIFLYSKLFGIALFPVVICIPFVEEKACSILIKTGIALYILSFIFRIFRGFQISFKINFSIFYLILYLCAVEILPLLLLGKFFKILLHS
ncbi:MAG: DUF4271 domain-containing protein [Bacteroidia bacterium]|nr:DUF4271 domain-containing protein [Bacteroidia bacterium]